MGRRSSAQALPMSTPQPELHFMLRYETLFLTIPELTNDEASQVEKAFTKLITDAKGSVISFERWGKFRLAYPVKKNEYGVYFLVRFEAPAETHRQLLDDIRTLVSVKFTDLVMRAQTSKLEPNESLVYERPKSLEETPVRDVDTFLKENKMDGLLKRDRSHGRLSRRTMEQTTKPAETSEEQVTTEGAE